MSRFPLLLFAAASVVAVLLGPQLGRSVQVNCWSLRLAEVVLQEPPPLAGLDRLVGELPDGYWRGRVALARAAVRAGASEQALGWLEPVPEGHPWVFKARAEALAGMGRWGEAFAVWAAAGDKRALGQAAVEAFTEGREADGLAARRSWFELDPVAAASPLAEAILRVERDPKQAAQLLHEVAKRYPDAPVTTRQSWWYQAGNYFRAAREWDQAEAAYAALAAITSQDWRPGVGRAWLLYQRDGDVEGALSRLMESQRRAPESGEPWVEGGLLLFRERRFAEAADWLTEAVVRNPESRWWHLWRANAVREAGDLEQGRRLHEEVSRRFPDFPQAYYELAWSCYRLEAYDEALAAIARAIELQERPNGNFWWRAAMVAERAGRRELAARYCERVLELVPDHRAAREALARLTAPGR